MDSSWQRPPIRIRPRVRPHADGLLTSLRRGRHHSRPPARVSHSLRLRHLAEKPPSSSHYRLAILHTPLHQPALPNSTPSPPLNLKLELHNLPADAPPPERSTLANAPRHGGTRPARNPLRAPVLHLQSHAHRPQRPDTPSLIPLATQHAAPRCSHPAFPDRKPTQSRPT